MRIFLKIFLIFSLVFGVFSQNVGAANMNAKMTILNTVELQNVIKNGQSAGVESGRMVGNIKSELKSSEKVEIVKQPDSVAVVLGKYLKIGSRKLVVEVKKSMKIGYASFFSSFSLWR